MATSSYNPNALRAEPILTIGSKVTAKEGFQLLDCQLSVHGICALANDR